MPLQVDYDRLRKTGPVSCDCDVSNQELEQTAQEIRRRHDERLFEAKGLHAQTSMKEPPDGK